jgi:hypothetical protein
MRCAHQPVPWKLEKKRMLSRLGKEPRSPSRDSDKLIVETLGYASDRGHILMAASGSVSAA